MGGNTWSDLFYPDNPRRREEVIRLSSRLYTLMGNNFSATNDLVDLINKHCRLGSSLSHVRIDYDATVRSNADVLMHKIKEIQVHLDEINEKLSKMIEPELYKELKSPDIDFSDKIRKATTIFSATVSVIGSVAGIALVSAISSGAILSGVVASMGVFCTCAFAAVGLGVLILGVDVLAGAILGAVERDKLEEAIRELERTLVRFEPACKEYQKTILRVVVTLENHFE